MVTSRVVDYEFFGKIMLGQDETEFMYARALYLVRGSAALVDRCNRKILC